MNEKSANTYEVKRLRMPVGISSTSKNNGKNRQSINPGSLFSVTAQQGVEISNWIGRKLKKYNIFDFNCLHGDPDKSAFDRMIAFSLLYKSELGDLDEVAADNATVSFVCGSGSEGFFKDLNESGYSTIKCSNGIYRVNVYMLIDVYIIVIPELGKAESGWMETLIRQAGRECQEITINGLECSFRTVEF